MIIESSQLSLILPKNNNVDNWVDPVNSAIEAAKLTTVERVAAFLAQTAHESADYTRLSENLNYSADGLVATWPSRFTSATATAYARNPEKIANKVYALRLGNGDEASGDGWKYRGRGILQVTGKNNYKACSIALYNDTRLLDTPELLASNNLAAIMSACWFWNVNNLNAFSDRKDITTLTKRINGGNIGLKHRIEKFEEICHILGN